MTQRDMNGDEEIESDFYVISSSSLCGLQNKLEDVEGELWRLVNVVYTHQSFIAFFQKII